MYSGMNLVFQLIIFKSNNFQVILLSVFWWKKKVYIQKSIYMYTINVFMD